MAHLSQDELRVVMDRALTMVVVGGTYRHYKQGDGYIVINVALAEEDDSPLVIYQADYGERITFARPLASWLETIEYNGKAVPRFVHVVN